MRAHAHTHKHACAHVCTVLTLTDSVEEKENCLVQFDGRRAEPLASRVAAARVSSAFFSAALHRCEEMTFPSWFVFIVRFQVTASQRKWFCNRKKQRKKSLKETWNAFSWSSHRQVFVSHPWFWCRGNQNPPWNCQHVEKTALNLTLCLQYPAKSWRVV